MPELPEVETVRRQLEKEIVGSEIVGEGKVIEVKRVGKYLFIKFFNGRGYEIHLKMTGRLVLDDPQYEDAKHTRMIINLTDGRKIYYWDIRKFGYVRVSENLEESIVKLTQRMGPEPWDITDIDLLRKLQKTGRSIKEAILDQSMLAGVGNIYANDGLWLAGIDPRRKANSLKLSEVKKLRASLGSVLTRGLLTGGASDNTYRDFYGEQGGYQNEFLVYGRTGERCNKCGKNLERIVVGGRGTWVCSKCQV
jgi:formamidopyrimidine-DNA glycosylase